MLICKTDFVLFALCPAEFRDGVLRPVTGFCSIMFPENAILSALAARDEPSPYNLKLIFMTEKFFL